MKFLPSLVLALLLTMGYLLFFRAQTESTRTSNLEASKAIGAPVAGTTDPYKADLDRARMAAAQMNAAKAEADSIK